MMVAVRQQHPEAFSIGFVHVGGNENQMGTSALILVRDGLDCYAWQRLLSSLCSQQAQNRWAEMLET